MARCGTTTSYVDGCRCNLCRYASAEAKRKQRKHRRGEDPFRMLRAELNRTARHWMKDAACAGSDPNLFFPDKGDSRSPDSMAVQAKAICAGCKVKVECRDYAMRNVEKFGIWGGLSERQRRRIRSKRAA